MPSLPGKTCRGIELRRFRLRHRAGVDDVASEGLGLLARYRDADVYYLQRRLRQLAGAEQDSGRTLFHLSHWSLGLRRVVSRFVRVSIARLKAEQNRPLV